MDTSFRTLSFVLLHGLPVVLAIAIGVVVWHRLWIRFPLLSMAVPALLSLTVYLITIFGSERANSLLISEHDFLTYLLFVVACGAVLGLLISARIPNRAILYAPVVAAYSLLIASPALAFIGQDGSGKADVIHAMWAFPLGLSLASGMRERFGVLPSLLAALMLAFVDEIIQWFLPQRVFDLHDIWLNGLAASTGWGFGMIRQIQGTPLYSLLRGLRK